MYSKIIFILQQLKIHSQNMNHKLNLTFHPKVVLTWITDLKLCCLEKTIGEHLIGYE